MPHSEHQPPQPLHHESDPTIQTLYRAAASGTVPAMSPEQVLQLQRQHGNQFVLSLLKARTGSAGAIQRDALEQNTTQAERKKLQIASLASVGVKTADELKAYFKEKTEAHLPVDNVAFDPTIAAGVQNGLKHMAVELIANNNLPFNTIISLALNLRPFGGVNGVYRFTLVQRTGTSKPQKQLIIEQAGDKPPAKLNKAGIEAQQKRFDQYELQWGQGFAADDNRALLLKALARMPDPVLERIRGVTFVRREQGGGARNEPGHYDPNTHTIEFFGAAFHETLNTVDAGGSSGFEYVVTHEISHAVDYEQYTRLRVKVAELAKQLADARAEAKKVELDDYDLNNKPSDKRKAKDQKVKDLQAEVNKARDEFQNMTQSIDVNKGGGHTNNAAYEQAKGNAISKYGGTKPVEGFAEMLSMYILDPKLLKSLRPEAFAYFERTIK